MIAKQLRNVKITFGGYGIITTVKVELYPNVVDLEFPVETKSDEVWMKIREAIASLYTWRNVQF